MRRAKVAEICIYFDIFPSILLKCFIYAFCRKLHTVVVKKETGLSDIGQTAPLAYRVGLILRIISHP